MNYLSNLPTYEISPKPNSYFEAGEILQRNMDYSLIQKSAYFNFVHNTIDRVMHEEYDDSSLHIRILDYFITSEGNQSQQDAMEHYKSIENSLYADVEVTVKPFTVKGETVPEHKITQRALVTKFPKLINNHFVINGINKCSISHLGTAYTPLAKIDRNNNKCLTFSSVRSGVLFLQIMNRNHKFSFKLPFASKYERSLQGTRTIDMITALQQLSVSSETIRDAVGYCTSLINQIDNQAGNVNNVNINDLRYAFTLSADARVNLNRRLSFASQITDMISGETIQSDDKNSEPIVHKGQVITQDIAEKLQQLGLPSVTIMQGKLKLKVFSNCMVDTSAVMGDKIDLLPKQATVKNINTLTGKEFSYTLPINKPLYLELEKQAAGNSEVLKSLLEQNAQELFGYCLTTQDLIALVCLYARIQTDSVPLDDKDSLSFKRLANLNDVFEQMLYERLFQQSNTNSFVNIISRAKSALSLSSANAVDGDIIYSLNFDLDCKKTITEQILSHGLFQSEEDTTNPYSQIRHGRKVTVAKIKGLGGVSPTTSDVHIRSVNPSYMGRFDPEETPEGKMIGLINYLASTAMVTTGGEIYAPYFLVDKDNKRILYDKVYYFPYEIERKLVRCISPQIGKKTRVVIQITKDYLSVHEEVLPNIGKPKEFYTDMAKLLMKKYNGDKYTINVETKDWFIDEDNILVTSGHGESRYTNYKDVDLVSPNDFYLISPITAANPFSERDEQNRGMMSDFQKSQAFPHLLSSPSHVCTPVTKGNIPESCEGVVTSPCNGVVRSITKDYILIDSFDSPTGAEPIMLPLVTNKRTPKSTFIKSSPCVLVGDVVIEKQVVADSPSTKNGELALGSDVLIGVVSVEGLDYEDSILVNRRIIQDGYGTSIHIEPYEVKIRTISKNKRIDTYEECITAEDAIFDSSFSYDNKLTVPGLDKMSISEINRYNSNTGIIKVGSIIYPGEVIGYKKLISKGVTKLKSTLYKGHNKGVVIDVRHSTSNIDSDTVLQTYEVLILTTEILSAGDKLAGNHGNKGVIGKVIDDCDMPYLSTGRSLDICVTPQGLPSRMNDGQSIEGIFGLIGLLFGIRIELPVEHITNIPKLFAAAKDLTNGGKYDLYDGRTGNKMKNKIAVLYSHYYKLEHISSLKILARDSGDYTMFEQAKRGKVEGGKGQRYGEMEFDTLFTQGLVNVISEILSCSSDDVNGRTNFQKHLKDGTLNQLGTIKPNMGFTWKLIRNLLLSMFIDLQAFDADGNMIDLNLDTVDAEGNEHLYTMAESKEFRSELLNKLRNILNDTQSGIQYSTDELDTQNKTLPRFKNISTDIIKISTPPTHTSTFVGKDLSDEECLKVADLAGIYDINIHDKPIVCRTIIYTYDQIKNQNLPNDDVLDILDTAYNIINARIHTNIKDESSVIVDTFKDALKMHHSIYTFDIIKVFNDIIIETGIDTYMQPETFLQAIYKAINLNFDTETLVRIAPSIRENLTLLEEFIESEDDNDTTKFCDYLQSYVTSTGSELDDDSDEDDVSAADDGIEDDSFEATIDYDDILEENETFTEL